MKAQEEIFKPLPDFARKSTTLDNGRENHNHFKLKELGTDTYSADLYSGWQRGSNEYHNGLLRRHFPKGTDFSKATQAGIIEMVKEINERLRKCLGDYTPNEVFLRELNRGGVAIRY
ncbi:IS30 family transposase [Candidatus Woesebacteria bacterium]|nr:IS30 family transposase [Candidatus Woesebacteria bacterium]